MLFRLVFLLFLSGAAVFAWRAWKLHVTNAARKLSRRELEMLRQRTSTAPLLQQAAQLREKIRQIDARVADGGAREGIDPAVRELTLKLDLMDRLEATAHELDDEASDYAMAKLRRESVEAPDADAREHAAQRLATLQRQRESAQELRRRRTEVLRAAERIVTGLQEVHVALLELSAAAGADGSSETVRARLDEASEELRRRASAHDEVKAFLEAAERG